ncbi:MAG: hypothetical protein ACE14S_04240 [Candidatus Bathyarchaeia archaeon]
MIPWAVYIPVLLTVAIVYFALFKFLKFLYTRHRWWFVAFLVFLSPFALVLVEVRDLLELLWVLVLTPFYGIGILTLLFTGWMVRFYCTAFAVLVLLRFLLQRRNISFMQRRENRLEPFLEKHLRLRVHTLSISTVEQGGKFWRGIRRLAESSRKYGSLLLVLLLAATVAATFVSAASLRNPTYEEALQFVKSDGTNQHTYVEGVYTCVNFAYSFRENAAKAGLNCGYVFIYFQDGNSHELNCFNCTDRGVVFVEPQTDEFVTLEVGKPYWTDALRFRSSNDTVARYYIDFGS